MMSPTGTGLLRQERGGEGQEWVCGVPMAVDGKGWGVWDC